MKASSMKLTGDRCILSRLRSFEFKTRRIQYRNINRYQLDRKNGILQVKPFTRAFLALELNEVNL